MLPGDGLGDSIKKIRESTVHSSLDKKKAKSVLRNAKKSYTL